MFRKTAALVVTLAIAAGRTASTAERYPAAERTDQPGGRGGRQAVPDRRRGRHSRTTSACRVRHGNQVGRCSGRRQRCSTTRSKQILTHFLSWNPERGARPARRGSTLATPAPCGRWRSRIRPIPTTSRPDAIEWLLLEVTGDEVGRPTGGTKVSVTTRIQRLNTVGGEEAANCRVHGSQRQLETIRGLRSRLLLLPVTPALIVKE